ncbi:organomercurial lyase [Spirillospora sp. CA-253888]
MPVSLDLEDLRLEVYRALAVTGRAPDHAALAERFGPGFREGLRELHAQRHLVLDGDDRVLMAHPFATIPLGFAVMGARTLWWGGCAWDSFALPHLVPDEPEALVSTRCPACGTPHAWNVTRDAPPEGGQVAHFLTPAARMWDDVVHTCGNQRVFCAEECVDAWLDRTGLPRGHVMDLATLWRLASRWYEGRLDRGYTRREPAEAAAYFREAGLTGSFWGL